MPVYAYECVVCKHAHDEVVQISNRNDPQPCPQCGGVSHRNEVASMRPKSTDQEYDRPLLSDALGVHPSQVGEAQSRFPHHEFTPDGRMILRSHNQRNRVLKELGYHDRDGYN